MKNIYYIEASGNYIIIYLKNRRIVTNSTLKHIAECLSNEEFIKVHKSYIVSINHIDRTESQSIFINSKELPISNTYRASFFERINQQKL
ncbi:MAG: LytR/AlgR family response regulator transcription factor [Crocinitomicaceae bacterium]